MPKNFIFQCIFPKSERCIEASASRTSETIYSLSEMTCLRNLIEQIIVENVLTKFISQIGKVYILIPNSLCIKPEVY